MREYAIFRSALGWMGILGENGRLVYLTFGHVTAGAARAALTPELVAGARSHCWNPSLVQRLRAYAAGEPDEFTDVLIEPGATTEFRRQVLSACRRIPYGETLTYAQLAALAGSPRAARAVGNCMASNRIPLVIPCHRVLPSGGKLGAYSAPAGPAMKRRLLDMESRAKSPQQSAAPRPCVPADLW